MTDSDILRPTPERLSKSDHLADDGAPTKERPYIRAARLGTAWDRYSRDRDGEGKLLADEAMILTRRQIKAGDDYIEAVETARWGGPSMSKTEVRACSGFNGPNAHAIEASKDVASKEARIRPRYLVSLVRAVLLEGYSAETWARATDRHPKSGIELFRVALDAMGEE